MRITKGQLRKIIRESQTLGSTEDIEQILQPHEMWLNSRGAAGSRANHPNVNLKGAKLRKGALQDALLPGANLRGADLQGAHLRYIDLSGAELQDADLRSANLRSANLNGANLNGADLQGANLRAAKLQDADLQGANLRHTDLRHTDLQGADLQGADLYYANLHNADLRGAQLDDNFRFSFDFPQAKFTPDALPWLSQHHMWPVRKDNVTIEGMSPDEVNNYKQDDARTVAETRIRRAVRHALINR